MSRPTMDDVAAAAGVSRALVSLVMRKSPRVSANSREKVLAAADELGYRPNVLARNLASGQTHTIGVMLNDLHNPYFTEMAEGAAHAAADRGLQLLMTSGWQRQAGEISAVDSLLNLRVDGLLLAAPRLPIQVVADFAAQAPVVVISAFVPDDSLDTINNDENHGAELIVDHLHSLGHRHIAHIDATTAAGGPERRSAFIDAMVGRGRSPIVVEGDFDERAGYEGARQLLSLDEPPTAIFAANDLSAIGVLTRLREAGRRVPEDISVVGYDDTLLAGVGTASLTTIHQPREQYGQLAIELLAERIAGRTEARHELIQPRLVTRTSTGPVA